MSAAVNLASPLVKHFEGLYLKAYYCPAGKLTIGYGCTRDVSEGQVITGAEANARLDADLADAERDVNDMLEVDLSDAEKAALISFTFNLGGHALENSTLLREINEGNKDNAAANFMMWNKAHVKGVLTVLPGLTLRRRAEGTLFTTGSWSP